MSSLRVGMSRQELQEASAARFTNSHSNEQETT